MDLTAVQSPQMDWDTENLPERRKSFRQHLELMSLSGPLAARKEENKCGYLLIWSRVERKDETLPAMLLKKTIKFTAMITLHFHVQPQC